MKKIIAIAALSIATVTAGFANGNNLTGPKYKNAHPSDKYDGTSEVLMRENPRQFQAAEFKNVDTWKFEKEIIEPGNKFQAPAEDLMASNDPNFLAEEDNSEKIIYKRVDINEVEGINKKGLKGPAYKNYKR